MIARQPLGRRDEPPPDVQALLDADRELTADEQDTLRSVAADAWRELVRMLEHSADRTYAVADPEQFCTCVFEHMNDEQRDALLRADTYACPTCSHPLKHRGGAS